MDLAVGIGRIVVESSGRGGQDGLGKVVVTAAVTTECASQAILFCASLNHFQILNTMDIFS